MGSKFTYQNKQRKKGIVSMKRIILVVLVVLLLSVSLVGCGTSQVNNIPEATSTPEETPTSTPTPTPEPDIPLDFKSINIFKDYAELTFISFEAVAQVNPPIIGATYSYTVFTSEKEGMIYLDMNATLKNISNTSNQISSLFTFSVNYNGTDYNGFIVSEKADGSDFDRYATLAPLESATIHFLVEIPKEACEGEIDIQISGNEQVYKGNFSYQEFQTPKKYVAINEVLEYSDISQLTLINVEYANILKPRKATGYYSYFEVEDPNKIFLILTVEVKNLKGNDLRYDNIAGVFALYNEKYNYDSFVVYEKEGGKDISNYTNISSISPLSSNRIYFVIEAPKEVQEGKVEIQLNYGGNKYFMEVKSE